MLVVSRMQPTANRFSIPGSVRRLAARGLVIGAVVLGGVLLPAWLAAAPDEPEPEPEPEPITEADRQPVLVPGQVATELAYKSLVAPCYGGKGDIQLYVHSDVITSVYLEDTIDERRITPGKPGRDGIQVFHDRGFSLRTFLNRVTVFAPPGTAAGARAQFRVTTSRCDASIQVIRVPRAADAYTIVDVVVVPEEHRARDLEARRKLVERAKQKSIRPPRDMVHPARKERGVERAGYHVMPTIQHGWWENEVLFLAFDLENSDQNPGEVAAVEVRDRQGLPYRVDIEHIERFEAPPKNSNKNAARIPGARTARGFVSLPQAGRDTIKGLRLVLLDDQGTVLAYSQVDEWDTIDREERKRLMVADFDAAIREKREREAYEREREARDARARQIFLGPRVSYGGCWLADAANSSNLDATGCTMVGATLTRGILEMFAFEVDGVGGWTGETTAGSARFGRITGSGVLRLGPRTIPYFRVGIGGQVASVDGSTDADLVMAVGGGVDKRLGNNILVGIGLSWARSLGESATLRQSIGIGAHVSIGWASSGGNAR